MTNLSLQACLGRVRRRLLAVGWAAGIVWAIAAALAVLLVGVWLDLLWELSAQWRVALLWARAITGDRSGCIFGGKGRSFQPRPVACAAIGPGLRFRRRDTDRRGT